MKELKLSIKNNCGFNSKVQFELKHSKSGVYLGVIPFDYGYEIADAGIGLNCTLDDAKKLAEFLNRATAEMEAQEVLES